ncbi:MAG: hypothetical protein M3094_00500 [Actinomycetia bacterium]|nr:hypothetical protein [Actinomycetes bacterium]
MDRTTRWETEAMRSTPRARSGPPRPSGKRPSSTTNWVTLREAEAATSVPVNTLRKWVRKADLPSYLESDGDIALRMVDLDAVIARADELGRTVEPHPEPSNTAAQPEIVDDEGEADDESTREPEPGPLPESDAPMGTMIVPIDAWNKMLNQLGNLHEAGQQLAEARERAAKAETESRFLRERLAEIRASENAIETSRGEAADVDDGTPDVEVVHVEIETAETTEPDPASGPDTTTYWRYLTTGWRERKKHRHSGD